jgi:hypothetical protein
VPEWNVHSLLASSWLGSVNTSTTVRDVHRGAVLPEARAIVVAVPLIILTGFWWLVKHRGK